MEKFPNNEQPLQIPEDRLPVDLRKVFLDRPDLRARVAGLKNKDQETILGTYNTLSQIADPVLRLTEVVELVSPDGNKKLKAKSASAGAKN